MAPIVAGPAPVRNVWASRLRRNAEKRLAPPRARTNDGANATKPANRPPPMPAAAEPTTATVCTTGPGVIWPRGDGGEELARRHPVVHGNGVGLRERDADEAAAVRQSAHLERRPRERQQPSDGGHGRDRGDHHGGRRCRGLPWPPDDDLHEDRSRAARGRGTGRAGRRTRRQEPSTRPTVPAAPWRRRCAFSLKPRAATPPARRPRERPLRIRQRRPRTTTGGCSPRSSTASASTTTSSGRMKAAPPTRPPAMPRTRQRQKIATCVDAGPESRLAEAIASSYSVLDIQRRSSTQRRRKSARWAGGPPNPVMPMRPHCAATTRSGTAAGAGAASVIARRRSPSRAGACPARPARCRR